MVTKHIKKYINKIVYQELTKIETEKQLTEIKQKLEAHYSKKNIT